MDVTTDVEPDFKSQFYNLQGTHIAERKRNLYKLLNSTNPDLSKDQIDIQPRNYQENIFYVDVLIYFRQVEKLVEILEGGSGVLASKILKQQWFFREAFKNMSEEDIVDDFLPSLSFCIRMKVLKKLSLTLGEERMDIIFDLLLERYGLFVAKQFLFSCSSQKIINILKNNEITLLPEQLKRILQKDIEVLKVYFEEYTKNMRRDFDDHTFLSYVAWKHPNLYFDLGLNTKHNINLGRFTTRAVINTEREKVLNDIQNSRWNKAALVREVKTFDKEYLFLFFPDDMNFLSDYYQKHNIISLVSKYPIKKRWEVFSQAFKQVYKKEVVEHLEVFDDELANLFPHEIKQKWEERKYIEANSLRYMKYYDSKEAFKILKDKINVTSDINERGDLLNELITVCCENKDYSTYEAVLKYICLRHRNDDSNVRANMIFHIKTHTDYNLLTEDHWNHINEILDIQRARGESLPFDFMAEYLLFVYQNKHPLDEPVTQYVKYCIKNFRSFRLFRGSAESEGNILKYIVKILPTLQLENEIEFTFQIMSDIMGFNNDNIFNKDFKSVWIDFTECKSIMDLIKEVCTKKEPYDHNDYEVVKYVILYNCIYSEKPLKVVDEDGLLELIKKMSGDGNIFGDCILEVIKKPKRNTFQNTLLDYYFNNADKWSTWNIQNGINHFLAEESEVIEKYFSVVDEVLELMMPGGKNIIGNCILEVIKKPKRNTFENTLLDYYFNNADKWSTWNIQHGINHFLAKEPEVIEKYFSVVDKVLELITTKHGKENIIGDCILEVIRKPKRNTFENTLLDYYFNNTDKWCTWNIQNAINHFLAKEPEVIEKYFSVVDEVLELIKKMPGEKSIIGDCILEVIKKSKRNTFENTLLDYYFNNTDKWYTWNIQNGINHFLAKEPEVIAKYFSVILPLDVECSMLNYDTIKKYSHLELDNKLISHFQDLVSISSKYDKKINIIKALSRVMDTKSFLDLVKDYTPVEKKLDLKNQEQTELYQLQCDIAKAFRKLDEPSLLAPVLMHFAQGDYLQSSLPAVYRVLYRINQEQASFYLNVLGGRAVSTRKHAAFLGFELLSLKDATTLYSQLSNKETNISAKKYLLDAVLKYFLKNPLVSVLDIVFQHMDFVDKNDTEMIQTVVEAVKKIPNRNRPYFVEKVWNLLDNLEQQEGEVLDYRNQLLETVNEQGVSFIFRLNKNFCENLIKRYFFASNNTFLGSVVLDYFVINYLLSYLDEQRFEFVFNVIKSYKDIHWKSNNDQIEHIFSFFNNAYKEFDHNDVKFLYLFVKFWQQLFDQKECIFQHTLLRLMVLYKENTDIETFSGAVDKFAQVFIEEYGPYTNVFFIDSIKTFYGKIPNITDFHLANFAFHLLKANSSEFNCFAAYSIIKNFASTEKGIYLKVVDILNGIDNATARLFCDILPKRI